MSKCPKWLEKAVFYEIYPQSYYDTNNDGIGDIQGIIEKLDYVKSLGCDAIWLNPWYDSPFLDAGYDVRDFYKIAPRYGTNDDAKRLFEEAKKRDMRIVVDLVAGHTSLDCEWFVRSCETEKNEYSDRYIWSPFIAWRGDEDMSRDEDYYISGYAQRGAYKVNFYYNQPALNYGFYKPKFSWEQPMDAEGPQSAKAELMNIMRFWMDMGCSGFRVDMASSLVKRDREQKGIVKFWREIRKMFDTEYKDCVLISEWGDPATSIKAGFHCDFAIGFKYVSLVRDAYAWSFPNMPKFPPIIFSREGKGDIKYFLDHYMKDYENCKGKGYISLISGNHDIHRISKYMTPDEMKVYYAFLFTMPGVPFLYYGDEIGMKYIENLPSKEGGDVRTGARTPMQWNNWENKGFSKGRKEDLYLPVDESENAPTVNDQYDDPNSILSKVRELIAIRKKYRALAGGGEFVPVYMKKNTYPFVYERSMGKKRFLVFLNPAECDKKLELKVKGAKGLKTVSAQNTEASAEKGTVSFNAKGIAYGIYEINE